MAHVYIKDGSICVRSNFSDYEKCKSVLGGRWNKAAKAWNYPLSPYAAQGLLAVFPVGVDTWDVEALALADNAAAQKAAAGLKTATELAPIPFTKRKPWHHQLQAYWFAQSLPACMLAMDMATGKSKVAIDLIVNRNAQSVLILCPKPVVEVWPTQFEAHCPVRFVISAPEEGSIAKRLEAFKQHEASAKATRTPFVAVVNFDAAWREPLKDWLLAKKWDVIVLDESHRIKAPGGKASMFAGRLGKAGRFRLCLTGTPLPHSPLDIYGQYRFLDPGIFGTSFSLFRSRYAIMGGYGNHEVTGYQNEAELHEKMYRIAFRVMADDVLELPEYQDIARYVRLTNKTMELYRTLNEDLTAEVAGGTITAANALTKLLRLQQITGGYVQLDRDIETGAAGASTQIDTAKEDALRELLEDMKPGEPVAVFCRFHEDLNAVHRIAAALNRKSLELSGRRNELKAWQSGAAPILAAQIQSGSMGVDMTRARYQVFYSLGYSLVDYLQARKRTLRPGQKSNVTYFHIVARGTVDEEVYAALEKREEVVEYILTMRKGDRKSWNMQQGISA